MFPRFKRKPAEDEEFLVPHGFLWQATDEPPEAEHPLNETPAKHSPAQPVVEIPVTSVNPVQASTPLPQEVGIDQQDGPKLGSISPPLRWPSPKIQDVRRSPALPNIPLPSKDSVARPLPAPVREPATELVVVTRREKKAWIQPAFAKAHSRVLAVYSRMQLNAVRLSSVVVARLGTVRRTYAEKDLSGRFAAYRKLVRAQIKNLRERVQPARETTLRSLQRSGRAFVLYSKSALHGLQDKLRTADVSRAKAIVRRVSEFKVTVRIQRPRQNRISDVLASAEARLQPLRVRLARDSRLWTSMAMAGASALLALVLISSVRHYGEANLPSKLFQRGASSNAIVLPSEVARPVHPKPAATRKGHANAIAKVEEAHSTNPNQSTSQPRIAVIRPVVVKRKPAPTNGHYSEEEDYVARDTYVYYGNSGKPGR